MRRGGQDRRRDVRDLGRVERGAEALRRPEELDDAREARARVGDVVDGVLVAVDALLAAVGEPDEVPAAAPAAAARRAVRAGLAERLVGPGVPVELEHGVAAGRAALAEVLLHAALAVEAAVPAPGHPVVVLPLPGQRHEVLVADGALDALAGAGGATGRVEMA